MSEMLANQYFISERYSEAFEEYSKLPRERKNNVVIREKMIISAAFDENFEDALSMIKGLMRDKLNKSNEIKIDTEVCPSIEAISKFESQIKQKQEHKDVIKMKIAILTFFSDQDKSLDYFKKLKGSIYADIVNPFLKSLNKTIKHEM